MSQAPFNQAQTTFEEVKPTTFLPQNYGFSQAGQAPITSSQYLGSIPVPATTQQPLKGESRIEYVPYEKAVIEYEAVPRTEYVAREKKVVDHYAVEYQTEYIPQVFHDRYIEYVPQERVVERIEYTPVERQIVHQPHPEVVQQEVPVAPVQFQTVQVAQPAVQQVVTSQAPVQFQPLTTSYIAQPQYITTSNAFPQTQFVQKPFTYAVEQPKTVPTNGTTTGSTNVVQKKIQPNGKAQTSEPGFLDMLFGFASNN
jgi:hypothetical protein